MFLAVMCQHASGACQSNSRPVLSLREASRKYVELSPSTLISDTPISQERSDADSKSTLNPTNTPSAWMYSFNFLEVAYSFEKTLEYAEDEMLRAVLLE
jgi:hypothetical protein